MEKNTYIKITPLGVETNELTFQDAFELLMSTLRQFSTELIQKFPDNQELKDTIYDWLNQGVSGILHEIAPETDPNPDIDINQVIAMQDLYIKNNLDKMKAENPRLYKKAKKQVETNMEEQRAKILEFKQKHPQF